MESLTLFKISLLSFIVIIERFMDRKLLKTNFDYGSKTDCTIAVSKI